MNDKIISDTPRDAKLKDRAETPGLGIFLGRLTHGPMDSVFQCIGGLVHTVCSTGQDNSRCEQAEHSSGRKAVLKY